MAMVARALAATAGIEHKICVTAQHREMLDPILRLLKLEPDFDLDVMLPRQGLADITSAVLHGVRDTLEAIQPDRILVQGDTTTVLAASLAAFYAKIPVGHVEAGLRTGNMMAPWPEEMNRRVVDILSDRHYAPTEQARQNLLAEGLSDSGIIVTGNPVIDTLLHVVARLQNESELVDRAKEMLPERGADRRWILVTAHRRENFGAGFAQICRALVQLGARDDMEIVYPVHMNPAVQEPIRHYLGNQPHIRLIDPLDYLSFVHLMTESHIILTDSGGIQEEAPALGKPLLVMRDATERPEGVTAGTARLVGADAERITREVTRLLDDEEAYAAMARAHNPYGDGRASQRIRQDLLGD